jgi:hypothetical protein
LHNEELYNLYSLPRIIRMIKRRRMRWAGHVARIEAKRKVCSISGRTPDRNRSLERLKHRWFDNIKMALRVKG